MLRLVLSTFSLLFDEIWHEESVRNQLQPRKSKGWVCVRIKFFKKLSHVEKDLLLCFLVVIEAVTHIYSSKDTYKHSVVRLLVKHL
jgi:cell division protein FtsL